jgi:Trk K+ transport system NAD-binding subunit
MKFLTSQLAYFVETAAMRRNLRILVRFLVLLVVLIVVYSVLFHVIMEVEGQAHSWMTGFYWTLTVMSTLGFGDITFQSDLGRFFSTIVLLSGVVFLLIVLPFTFIQFFYAPWLEAQTRRRVPQSLPDSVRDHVLIAAHDPVATTLIPRLEALDRPYYLLEPDLARALSLEEEGLKVVLGSPEDIETYRRVGVERAAMLVANVEDAVNTNIAFTTRELDGNVSIVSFARDPASVDILELAGSTTVLQLAEMLGRSLARRTLAGGYRAGVIGRFGELVVAEAPVVGTPLVGKSLGEGWLREWTGLTAVGVWERGTFSVPGPETTLTPWTVLLLAGTEAQLEAFVELTAIYRASDAPVLILGCGRVGSAAARALEERGLRYRMVEQNPDAVRIPEHTVVGNAAELHILEEAGIREAPTVLVTTSSDATNIYLTVYCRRLRPDIQIVSRATMERNVSTLHRAGADFVMSYASMGANAVLNVLQGGDVLMVAEGLDLFRVRIPEVLRGVPLGDSGIRVGTGCNVVAVQEGETLTTSPAADFRLPADPAAELILVGTPVDEHRFMQRFNTSRERAGAATRTGVGTQTGAAT